LAHPKQVHRFDLREVKTYLIALGLFASCSCAAFDLTSFNARGSNQITAVSARASDDYVRVRQHDGSFPVETYAFGRGGDYGGPVGDPTIAAFGFTEVAREIAGTLATQNYLPSKDPNSTRFLIMVYWGTSTGPASNPIQFRTKELWDMQLTRNAMLLGYDTDLRASIGLDGKPQGWKRADLFGDIALNRYFVVLMAYDFQILWRQKKHKLVWETRFSLREAGHDFGKEFPMMAQYAAKYFGQNTRGLVRTLVPEGHVDIGEVQSLGAVPEK
jgi:hypothetical protein